MEVVGNTSGLAPAELKNLERLYRRKVPFDTLFTDELARTLCAVSAQIRRQVGVLINRVGTIDFVVVGDATKLFLPDLGRIRAAQGRFRGVRLIHTHLRHEALTRDDLVDLTRLRLDMIAAICLYPDGRPGEVYYAHCQPVDPASKEPPFTSYGPIPWQHLDCNPAELVGLLEAQFAREAQLRPVRAKEGRAILAHVCTKAQAAKADDALNELRALATTAGLEIADVVIQTRDHLDPNFVLGRGKLEDVVIRAMQLDADMLIFDNNLKPAQAAAIAGLTDLKVIDRTQLILDIFAQRAESRDGKLQVELAQMRYLLPRLGVRDDALSRLTGGIGGRGPGETKLEIGKRRARERITYLEAQLKQLKKQREQRRSRRQRTDKKVIALIGYTNAGKSTLLNALTHSDVLAENKLFATLDTRARQFHLPGLPRGQDAVLIDTVGFIRNMPKDLFAAFRATLEEVQDADLIIEVVDASDADVFEHIRTTEHVLGELDLLSYPRLRVCNKCDKLELQDIAQKCQALGGMALSVKWPASLDALKQRIIEALQNAGQPTTLDIASEIL